MVAVQLTRGEERATSTNVSILAKSSLSCMSWSIVPTFSCGLLGRLKVWFVDSCMAAVRWSRRAPDECTSHRQTVERGNKEPGMGFEPLRGQLTSLLLTLALVRDAHQPILTHPYQSQEQGTNR